MKNLNLQACTTAILNEEKWETIFASGRAYASNDIQKKTSLERKIKLFQWLDLNLKNHKTLDDAAYEACENQIVPLGFDQIRKMITLYLKEKSNGK